jgi:hypothetical protein
MNIARKSTDYEESRFKDRQSPGFQQSFVRDIRPVLLNWPVTETHGTTIEHNPGLNASTRHRKDYTDIFQASVKQFGTTICYTT